MTTAVIALLVLLGSALMTLALGRAPRLAATVAALGVVAAAALVVPLAVSRLAGADAVDAGMAWAQPVGRVRIGMDALTAFFAAPLLILAALCALYGAFYLDGSRGRRRVEVPAAMFNLLVAGMFLVLLARDAISFLVGWEVMTLASYLLITFEHDKAEVRRAGWVYLIAGHVGVLALLALFVGLGHLNGELDFGAWRDAPVGGGTAVGMFALALLCFGIKAGIVPMHVWLPEAHAAAPSHVSALMSGMLIKVGLYGLLRSLTFLTPAEWWGPLLACLGAVTALLGIGMAFYQRDLKRVLAYSSIENVGVIVLAIGIGYWAAGAGHTTVAILAFCGALLHVWNHVLMKGLLFLTAGAIVHGTGTRDLERLGGLLPRMPRTATLFVLGGVAIAALPPLCGFASEWLVYRALIEGALVSGPMGAVLSGFAVATLAAVGVFATLCFVRAVGVGLLGQPRSPEAAHAHEAPAGLLWPMAVLAAGAVAMPLVAFLLAHGLEPVVAQLTGGPIDAAPARAALEQIAVLSAVLWGALLVVFALATALTRRRRADDTWGCGYAAPTPRMQYTGRSFAELGQGLFPRWLRPRMAVPRVELPFPGAARVTSASDDPFTRGAYEPFLDHWAHRFARLRWLQQGSLHVYLIYILVVLLLGLTSVAAESRWGWPWP
jgi:formate hydrogenlyase subunit 3/multisubunit Na+/H+ antiporter MnhD subunit